MERAMGTGSRTGTGTAPAKRVNAGDGAAVDGGGRWGAGVGGGQRATALDDGGHDRMSGVVCPCVDCSPAPGALSQRPRPVRRLKSGSAAQTDLMQSYDCAAAMLDSRLASPAPPCTAATDHGPGPGPLSPPHDAPARTPMPTPARTAGRCCRPAASAVVSCTRL